MNGRARSVAQGQYHLKPAHPYQTARHCALCWNGQRRCQNGCRGEDNCNDEPF